MEYNNKTETFVDYVNWTKDDPCIWVVYPAGAGGDLVSAIINFHYANTGAKFHGITETGQVIFRDTNKKIVNLTHTIDLSIVADVEKCLSEEHTNYSKIDQIIFSNHAYKEKEIEKILNLFTKSKIIRIIPKNKNEYNAIQQLSNYKNGKTFKSSGDDNSWLPLIVSKEQVLEIYFSDLFNRDKFNQAYKKIRDHLNLPYKLISYNFIEFYLSKQDKTILQALSNLVV
jgi:hypothetical protein